MIRADGTTSAELYVQALTAGATPEEAYRAAYPYEPQRGKETK